jgi:hypothetical protein
MLVSVSKSFGPRRAFLKFEGVLVQPHRFVQAPHRMVSLGEAVHRAQRFRVIGTEPGGHHREQIFQQLERLRVSARDLVSHRQVVNA